MQCGFYKEIPVNFESFESAAKSPWFETSSEQVSRWIKHEWQRRQLAQIASNLNILTPRQELAFRLYLIGYSYRQIAKFMRVNNVKTAYEYIWGKNIRGKKKRYGGAIQRIKKAMAEMEICDQKKAHCEERSDEAISCDSSHLDSFHSSS